MEKFELNDFRKLRELSDVTFSPDGRHIAVVVKACNEQDGYDFTIWARPEDGEFRQLTSFGKESSYLWDDAKTMMFLSLRDPADQKRAEAGEELTGVYRLSLEGGELHVDGQIDSLAYEDDRRQGGGFFSRLFG